MTASSASFNPANEPDLDFGQLIEATEFDLRKAFPRASTSYSADDEALRHEHQLVHAAQREDHDAYRKLVELHQEKVLRFCRQILGHEEDARETCQDTFVRAYDGLTGFEWRNRARFSTWLFRIALNLCRDRMRSAHQKRRQITDPISDTSRPATGVSHQPDESLLRHEDMQKLRRGLDALPPRLREALVLFAIEDLSHRQCAEILRCSERAVEGRVHRARQRLIEWWNREG